MTRKRYQKLLRSEMTKLMQYQKDAGMCIRAAAMCIRAAANATLTDSYNSYQEAWDAIRVCFIRLNNKIVPIS